MAETLYKDFIIEAAPYRLADSGKWAMQVYIRHDTGDSVQSKPFSAANTFDTKEEATAYCINFGKQIIDGHVPDCNVEDLL